MRHEDWPKRLAEYIEVKRSEPFKWGANDCALFARGAVESIHIDSPTKDLVLKYRSQKGAHKWLVDNESADLWDFIDKHFERIDARIAQRGDLIGHMTTDKSLGVCLGDKFATPSDDGILFASLNDALTAWRV